MYEFSSRDSEFVGCNQHFCNVETLKEAKRIASEKKHITFFVSSESECTTVKYRITSCRQSRYDLVCGKWKRIRTSVQKRYWKK